LKLARQLFGPLSRRHPPQVRTRQVSSSRLSVGVRSIRAAAQMPTTIRNRKQVERSVLYTFIFAGLAVLLVVAVLVRNARNKAGRGNSETPTDTAGPSSTARSSAARQERKRRRAQSKNDRRKRR